MKIRVPRYSVTVCRGCCSCKPLGEMDAHVRAAIAPSRASGVGHRKKHSMPCANILPISGVSNSSVKDNLLTVGNMQPTLPFRKRRVLPHHRGADLIGGSNLERLEFLSFDELVFCATLIRTPVCHCSSRMLSPGNRSALRRADRPGMPLIVDIPVERTSTPLLGRTASPHHHFIYFLILWRRP